MNTHSTREAWLAAFIAAASPVFRAKGYQVPANIRASVGFPSTGRSGKRIGECWSDICSTDGTFEIFIHPSLDNPARVCDILTHEIVHAVVGLEAGHKKPFKQCATALGLVGKMTATIAGPDWHAWASPILIDLGPLPHAALNADGGKKKQTTRMLKVTCKVCDMVFRVSKAHIDRCVRCPDDECDGFLSYDSEETED